MLAEFACRYVIVGHSERRQLFGESDAQVAANSRRPRRRGHDADPVRGRDLQERDAGRTEDVVARQLDGR
jgi:triosephosphate isomerase